MSRVSLKFVLRDFCEDELTREKNSGEPREHAELTITQTMSFCETNIYDCKSA